MKAEPRKHQLTEEQRKAFELSMVKAKIMTRVIQETIENLVTKAAEEEVDYWEDLFTLTNADRVTQVLKVNLRTGIVTISDRDDDE